MQNCLDYAQKNSRPVSYLSAEVQNEFIQLLGSTVRNKLLSEIKMAKYYSLIFDWNPDVAHRVQMTQTVWYVDINFEEKTVTVKESFLGFIQVTTKTQQVR